LDADADHVSSFAGERAVPLREQEFPPVTPLPERQRPTGPLRLLLRFPIYLYRMHLGWLLGSRFLLLTHRGRRSGLDRQTVLEVVDHAAAGGTYFVASGWGEKADWFRNIQETPEVTVQVGGQRFAASAERLSVDAARKVFLAYEQRHPAAFRALAKVMTGKQLSGADEDWTTLARTVPIVALSPRQDPAP
jgi:deazaflavin-dependent oxidoreductase (nitroreductase family)